MPFRPQSGGCDQTHVHRGARAGEGGRRWGLVHGWACKRARPLWKTRAGHRRDPAVPPPVQTRRRGKRERGRVLARPRSQRRCSRRPPAHPRMQFRHRPTLRQAAREPGPQHCGLAPVRSSVQHETALGWGGSCLHRPSAALQSDTPQPPAPPPKPCLRGPWAQGFRSKSQQTKPTARTFTAAQGRSCCPGVHQRVTDEQNEIHPHNGISLSPKEGCSSDTCRDVDEPGTHHAK